MRVFSDAEEVKKKNNGGTERRKRERIRDMY